jgi:MscS family membrane protein
MMQQRQLWISLFFLLGLGFLSVPQAEAFQYNRDAPPVELTNPNNTMHVHLYYLQPDTYRPALAARTFPPSIDSAKRIKMAIQLKEVLDGQGLFVRFNMIPTAANYMDSSIMQHIFTPFPLENKDIYLERVDGKWYYSQETADKMADIHSKLYPWGTRYLLDIAPQWSTSDFGGLKIWKWLGIALLVILGFLLYWLFKGISFLIIRGQIVNRLHLVENKDKLTRQMAKASGLMLTFMILARLYPALRLPVEVAEPIRLTLSIFIAVMIFLLIYRLLRIIIAYFKEAAEKTETKMDDQIIPLIDGALTALVVVAAFFYILSLLHVNVAALIAGLSIGGIALALAAQDTVRNLLGSIMVFLDKPFQVGDFVEIDGEFGSIIEVGIRSTRIMTKDTSIISLPNGTVANMKLRNLGARHYRLFETEIGVTYDTPPERIEQFIDGIRHIMTVHPKVVQEDKFIYFSKLADSSLNIFIRVHINTLFWDVELEIKEGLYLDIIRLAHVLGIRFAFPSRALYIENFPEKKSLVPNYSEEPDTVEKGKLDYLKQLEEKYSDLQIEAEKKYAVN